MATETPEAETPDTEIIVVEKESNKYCRECKCSKPFSDYYKAGNTYQVLCKKCHNKSRRKWKIKKYPSKRVKGNKKPIGFFKLSQDVQDSIIQDISENNIKYATFMLWRRKGKIPISNTVKE